MATHSPHLQIALEAVEKAAVVIKKHYASNLEVELKEDKSPVTVADKEAERVIKDHISSVFPDHGFLGEEWGQTFGKNSNKSSQEESQYTWIIDPIDGTKNFVREIPFFGTQLALAKGDEIIIGVSNAPMLNELMYAEKGSGAFINGKKVSVSDIDKVEKANLNTGSIKHFDANGTLNNLMVLSNKVSAHRSFGDFWNYHLLSQGKIDIMIEAKAKIWDIAAASVIIKEAGGMVTDFYGKPFSIKSRSIFATNGLLMDKVAGFFG